MQSLNDRESAITDTMSAPPVVHMSPTARNGVWAAEEDCYRFMATIVQPGSRTLETGLGISTALLAAWGCEHTCIVYDSDEVDRLEQWFSERKIDGSKVKFVVGSSDRVMPGLDPRGDVDLFLIDGAHAWPQAIIDWYYGAAMLRQGGVLVLDDLHLKQVRMGLVDFLDADSRWERLVRKNKWAAYRRLSSGSLYDEWRAQSFLGVPLRTRYAAKVPESVKPLVKRVGKRLGLV